MGISELSEKRNRLWDQAQTYLDSKNAPGGMISAEDAATYDKIEADINTITDQIERLERNAQMAARFEGLTSKPLVGSPGILNRQNRGSTEYAKAFWNAIRGRGISNALAEGTDTSGGFLVPDEFYNELVVALQEQNVFRRIARIVNTSREKLKVPLATAAGTASWIDEGASVPTSDSVFGQVTLEAYKLGSMMKASTELIEDAAFDMESYIAMEFARRIGSKEEEAFCVGDGDGKPTGLFVTGGAGVGVTAASQTTITFDELIDLFYSLSAPYRAKAVFLTNDASLKAIRKLKGTDGQYLWQPSVKDGVPDTILGKPIYTSPYVPTMAAGTKAVAFGDFSYYWIADRRDTRFKVLNELYAETDQIGFLATERVDGKLILQDAVKLLQMASGS